MTSLISIIEVQLPPTKAHVIRAIGLLVLAGLFSSVQPALANCQLSAGAIPPVEPPVTAQQVEDGSATLMDFALVAKDQYKIPISTLEEALHFQCLVRQEGSPWRSGSTYIIVLTPDGRVYEHAKDMALSGRLLNPLIYGAILSALGVSSSDLASLLSTDSAVAAQAGNEILNILRQEPHALFDATVPIEGLGPGIPGATGYVVSYVTSDTQPPTLLFVGFDLDESHLVPISHEVLDYGQPTITASEVVDRETLKSFVTQAGEWFISVIENATEPAAVSKAKIAARDPNGPWRHDAVYLYALELNNNIILFHGAFPDLYEWRPLVPRVRDAITGLYVLPQIIQAATSNPEGGFVEYHFDDPTDDTDSADIPKVGYARRFAATIGRPDGSAFTLDMIVGSGFYHRSPEDAPTTIHTETTWGQLKSHF